MASTYGRARACLVVAGVALSAGCVGARTPSAPKAPASDSRSATSTVEVAAPPKEASDETKTGAIGGALIADTDEPADEEADLVALAHKRSVSERQIGRSGSVKGPTRPSFFDERHFAYATLPLVEDVRLRADEQESFWLVVLDQTSKFCAPGEPRPKHTWRFSRAWPRDAVIRVDDFLLPPPAEMDGDYEDDDLYQAILVAPWDGSPVPKHMSLAADAEWIFVDRSQLTRDSVPVSRYLGRFSDMAAHATRASTGKARALVHNELYAFRQCMSHCDEPLGSTDRVEELGVIAPPALWNGSSGKVPRLLSAKRQPFTFVAAAVRSGSSASILLDVPNAEHDALLGAKRVDGGTTSYEIDVVWEEGHDPDVTVFSGSVAGAPAELHEARSEPHYQEDCL